MFSSFFIICFNSFELSLALKTGVDVPSHFSTAILLGAEAAQGSHLYPVAGEPDKGMGRKIMVDAVDPCRSKIIQIKLLRTLLGSLVFGQGHVSWLVASSHTHTCCPNILPSVDVWHSNAIEV